MPSYFITGTDTGIGKTWATLTLMQALQQQGKRVTGMKPIASGCQNTDHGLRNDDALQLLAKATQPLASYSTINPYPLASATAPHIAAAETGIHINLHTIATALATLQQQSDIVLVEGIGGWCVPLTDQLMLADLVEYLALPVILVIGMRLGCINHSIATTRLMQADGAKLQGWLINCVQPVDLRYYQPTLNTLKEYINAPFLGTLPYMQTLDLGKAAEQISTSTLIA